MRTSDVKCMPGGPGSALRRAGIEYFHLVPKRALWDALVHLLARDSGEYEAAVSDGRAVAMMMEELTTLVDNGVTPNHAGAHRQLDELVHRVELREAQR